MRQQKFLRTLVVIICGMMMLWGGEVKAEQYQVTFGVVGNGGTIVASDDITSGTSVEANTVVTFTATPSDGYKVDLWETEGGVNFDEDNNGKETVTITITQDTMINVKFELKTYTIHTSVVGSNGAIAPTPDTTVNHGTDATLRLAANENCKLDSIYVDGEKVTPTSSTSHELNNVTEEHDVVAYFSPAQYQVTASANGDGSISPTDTLVNHGTDITLRLAANENCKLDSIYVDGEKVTPTSTTSHELNNVTETHNVVAYFSPAQYQILSSAAGTGTGTVTPADTMVNEGTSATIRMAPAADNQLDSVYVDGEKVTPTPTTSYEFTNVTKARTLVAYFSATPAPTQYQILSSAAGTGTGTVTPIDTMVNEGTSATIRMAPAAGNQLDSVYVDGEKVTPTPTTSYEFTNVTKAGELVAYFSTIPPPITTYAVTYNIAGGNGALAATVDGNPITTGEKVEENKTVVFTVTPDNGYEVNKWTVNGSDSATTSNSISVVITEITNVVVTLKAAPVQPDSFAVTFTNPANGTLAATVDGNPITTGEKVEESKTVVFTVTPNSNLYEVDKWTVNTTDSATTSNSISVVITEITNVVVTLKAAPVQPDSFAVTFTNPANGTLAATVDGNPITTGEKVEESKTVVFTVTPNSNLHEVDKWTVNTTDSATTSNSISVVITEITNVVVALKLTPALITTHTVTYSVAGANGTLSADTAGTSIGNSPAKVKEGKVITFTAIPSANYRVREWMANGAAVNGTNTNYTVTLSKDTTITVEFEAIPTPITSYTVTYSVTGGNGTLSADTAGTSIGNSPAKVKEGKVITFTATPNNGYRIKEWKANGTTVNGTDATYTVTLSKDTTVTVEFELTPALITTHTVTYSVAGANGTLSADTAGTTIGNSPATVKEGKVITFTAIPSVNYRVREWMANGTAVNGTNATYEVTLSKDTTITVEFEAIPTPITTHTVTYSVVGGNGTLSADTAGTSIGNSPAKVKEGKVITFTATPSANYRVKEWMANGTAVNGTNATYEVTLSKDTTVTVEFEAIPDSADLTLSSLTIAFNDGGTVKNLNLMGDSVWVGYDTAQVTIAATATDANATISGSGEKSVQVGKNVYTITVTDNVYLTRKASYNVIVFRYPEDSTSTILDINIISNPNEQGTTVATMPDSTFTPAEMQGELFSNPNSVVFSERFNPDVHSYTAQAGCSVDSIKIGATPTDANHPVTGVKTMKLNIGQNIDTLEANGVKYVLKVYKSLDTTLAIRKKFGTLTFVNNPHNNGTGERFSTYQWFMNGAPIAGATGQYYILPQPATTGARYTVSVTSLTGWLISTCPSSNAQAPHASTSSLNVYPNPASANSLLNIEATGLNSMPLTVEVYDLNGALVRSMITNNNAPEATAPAQAGTYVVKVLQNNQAVGSKVIVVK